jgi:hypothetical protein
MSQVRAERCARPRRYTPLARNNSASRRAADADGSTLASSCRTPIDKSILEFLVIALAMVVTDKLLEGPPGVVLAQGTIRLRHSCMID